MAYGYRVQFLSVGEDDPEVGPPTQLAIFQSKGDDPLEPPPGAPNRSWEKPRPRMHPDA